MILSEEIGHSDETPCAENTITVTLQTNTPLLTTSYSNCVPTITIAGLTTTATVSQDLAITEVTEDGTGFSEIFGSHAAWEQGTGTLILNFTDTLLGGPIYVVSLVLTNPATDQGAATPSYQLWSESSATDMTPHAGFEPLFVPVVSMTATVVQTSDVPCEDNTITIQMTTSDLMPL
eukprot:2426107-Rhodomonas_salina.1